LRIDWLLLLVGLLKLLHLIDSVMMMTTFVAVSLASWQWVLLVPPQLLAAAAAFAVRTMTLWDDLTWAVDW